MQWKHISEYYATVKSKELHIAILKIFVDFRTLSHTMEASHGQIRSPRDNNSSKMLDTQLPFTIASYGQLFLG